MFIKQYSAGVVIYRVDECQDITYLLLQYPRGPWDFAKGKLESGESWKKGAVREAKEETGINLFLDEDFEHVYNYTFSDSKGNKIEKTVMFFIAKSEFNAQITLSQEHIDYLWLPYHQARMHLHFENIRFLLDQVNNHLETKKTKMQL